MDLLKVVQILGVVKDVVTVGGALATELQTRFAAAGIEVTEAEWDALAAGFGRIADTARREIAAER